MRATREILGISLAMILLLTVGMSTCHSYKDKSERIAALEAQVSEARHRTDSLTRLVDSVTRNVTERIASNRKVGQRLSERLVANDSLLSTDSADVLTLRVALTQTTEVARLYRDSTEMLHNSVDVMIAAHVTERQAWLAERERNTILVATQDSVISALRESRQTCRLWIAPCPSRVQSVAIGAGSIILLLFL